MNAIDAVCATLLFIILFTLMICGLFGEAADAVKNEKRLQNIEKRIKELEITIRSNNG